MKTLISRLGYGLILLIIIVSCSQPESEAPVIDTSMDVVEVDGEYMDGLMTAYKTFVENLTEGEKSQLESYVNSVENKSSVANGRTSVEALCRCLATQVSCYAKSNFSECCICWDPKTHVGACGLYFGVASCRIEAIKPKTPGDKAPSPTTPVIRIYPNDLKGLISYIEKNKLGKTNSASNLSLADFKSMLSSL